MNKELIKVHLSADGTKELLNDGYVETITDEGYDINIHLNHKAFRKTKSHLTDEPLRNVISCILDLDILQSQKIDKIIKLM